VSGDLNGFGRVNVEKVLVGSYALNYWVVQGPPVWKDGGNPRAWSERYFVTESDIVQPSSTPVSADGVVDRVFPLETDGPPFRTSGVDYQSDHFGQRMQNVLIARHGEHPHPLPNAWPANRPLPGAINLSFFDGHVAQVRLDDLWQLHWHKDWVPPTKRPGLP
jgi:prepilin-type processing-associated H-X9-DG protein